MQTVYPGFPDPEQWLLLVFAGYLSESRRVARLWLPLIDVDRAVLEGFEAALPRMASAPVIMWRVRVAGAVQGAAVALLCSRYHGLLQARARNVLSRPEDVEDAVSAVPEKLLRSRGLTQPDHPATFLSLVARSCAYDIGRDLERRGGWLTEEKENTVCDPDGERPFLAAEEAADCDLLLASLTPEEREVFRLRYEEKYSQEETGRRLGLTRDQVRTIEARIKRKLQPRLDPVHPRRDRFLPAALTG